jgi:acetyl-CoA carboxylase biotin carboxylase subunit
MTGPRNRITKVLVANRGEIAIRVFRTCRERGIATVAVYSDADRESLHVSEADEAVHIGPTQAAASYLNVEAIIDAAKRTGADAIHPGYGFLSERATLVEACDSAGITFIGPPAEAMRVMGDKVRSREAMLAAGVTVVPGKENVQTVEDALAAADEIGLPIMLKAAAGGGGKGMRFVHDRDEIARAFESAQREAQSAFGDGRLFVERAVMAARHVEIQLMADAQGSVVWLNERDCSVQRRHQKVIEEAPSPGPQMNADVRRSMGEMAVKVAKAVGYRSAGTVEFLFEETPEGPRFYFLEMNTRLQVEHPVTEATTGRDLVWDQIRVARGEPLGYAQEDIGLDGHAIECRIYAEDPIRFLPSPGTIRRLRWPTGSDVRVDTAVAEGSVVSPHYDPMIAKITVWGPDRSAALARMRRALSEMACIGISTNIGFHLRVLEEPDFVAGTFDTGYIGQHPALCAQFELPNEASRAAAAAAAVASSIRLAASVSGSGADHQISAWQRAVSWRE